MAAASGAARVAEAAAGLRLHLSSSNATGYKGVHKQPSGRFQAKHMVDGRKVVLGSFDTAVEGAVAYARAVGEAPGGKTSGAAASSSDRPFDGAEAPDMVDISPLLRLLEPHQPQEPAQPPPPALSPVELSPLLPLDDPFAGEGGAALGAVGGGESEARGGSGLST